MPEGARIYNLFPPLVGSTENWEKHLDRIAGMGFNWIFLNPFHYPGFSGSIYAVKDFYRLNPLFEGAGKLSAGRLILSFVAAAKQRGIGVMMDLVVNHTAKDSELAEQHPDWFDHEPDGSLKSPFAIDPDDSTKKTVWADLAEINYSPRPQRQEIVHYFCDVIRHYMRLGMRGFRCDAAYKVPKDVWRAMISAGRQVDEDVLFVAENLGSFEEQVEAMRGAGFDYLFNSSKWWDFRAPWLLDQYERFRSIAPSIAFPETHDTPRLAAELGQRGFSRPEDIERRYRQAYLFAAVFSTGVMIPIGFEYGFRNSLHVVKTRPSDWEKPAFDLTGYIGQVNRMRAAHPVFNEEGPQRAVHIAEGRILALIRRTMRGAAWAMTIINADPRHPAQGRVEWLDGEIQSGREVTPGREGNTFHVGTEVALEPGEIRVFVGD